MQNFHRLSASKKKKKKKILLQKPTMVQLCTVNHNNIRTPLSKMNLHWLKGETWLYFEFFLSTEKEYLRDQVHERKKKQKIKY